MPAGDDEAVLEWRLATLLEAGYDVESAEELAGRLDVDLHRAVDLVKRGCPPATAARILR